MTELVDVRFLQAQYSKLQGENDELRKKGHTGGGNPPGGGDMERRVQVLEHAIPDIRERLVRVETKVGVIEEHMATKSDLGALRGDIVAEVHKAINDQTWKFMGVATALAGLAFVAARFIPGAG